MKRFYTILLSIVCFMLSFTLSSQQKSPTELEYAEINDEITDADDDSKDDEDVFFNNDPNNYDEQLYAYGPGPCTITIID